MNISDVAARLRGMRHEFCEAYFLFKEGSV